MYNLREFLSFWIDFLLGHLYYDYTDCLESCEEHSRNGLQFWTEYAMNFYLHWLLKISVEEMNYEKKVKILPVTKKPIPMIEEFPFLNSILPVYYDR